MCDQHIRDDDNSYKELEFDRGQKYTNLTLFFTYYTLITIQDNRKAIN